MEWGSPPGNWQTSDAGSGAGRRAWRTSCRRSRPARTRPSTGSSTSPTALCRWRRWRRPSRARRRRSAPGASWRCPTTAPPAPRAPWCLPPPPPPPPPGVPVHFHSLLRPAPSFHLRLRDHCSLRDDVGLLAWVSSGQPKPPPPCNSLAPAPDEAKRLNGHVCRTGEAQVRADCPEGAAGILEARNLAHQAEQVLSSEAAPTPTEAEHWRHKSSVGVLNVACSFIICQIMCPSTCRFSLCVQSGEAVHFRSARLRAEFFPSNPRP